MRMSWGLGALACLALSVGAARAAVTEDSFLLHNTTDLVDLCSATQSDPLYTAATNFCHGFAVGAFRVLQEENRARRANQLFCIPDPVPSRNQAIAGFVQWAKGDAARTTMSPQDALAAYLSDQYKCPRGRR